jgi:predicted enzyme related to lactoylglutathione lyase
MHQVVAPPAGRRLQKSAHDHPHFWRNAMRIKAIGFVAIPVTDMDRARRFYEGVLGLKEIGRFMDGKWIEYGIGNDTLCIASINETWTPSDQGTGAALELEDFDEAIAELKKANVKFALEPFDSPVCHMAIVQDPDGNKLMIHKLKES